MGKLTTSCSTLGYAMAGATIAAAAAAEEWIGRGDERAAEEAAANAMRAALNTIDFANYVPADGAVYPEDAYGYALKSTAALIKAEVGVEAVAIDLGGWDTHNNQGPISGAMAGLMASLAGGLAAFHLDMFSGNGRNVTVVAMSEFERRLDENGSFGTDTIDYSAIAFAGGVTIDLQAGQTSVNGGNTWIAEATVTRRRVVATWPSPSCTWIVVRQDPTCRCRWGTAPTGANAVSNSPSPSKS